MPLPRCRNFNEDGSRKLKPNGYEVPCRPDCPFIHPSDPAWDRARPSGLRGRGGQPYASRGRSQSSFGASGSGANSYPLRSNQGSSSNSWDDYIPGSSSNPATTSNGWGSSSRWDSRAKAETTGWGDNATGDSGWGFNAKNDVDVPERKSAEPAASDVKSSTSQWGGHSADRGAPGEGWGMSDGNGWGSVNTGLEPGWGQDTSNQWDTTVSETTTSKMGSSMAVDTNQSRIEDGGDASKTADVMPPVVPAGSVSSQHDQQPANQPVRVSTTPSTSDPSPTGHEVLSPTLPKQSPVIDLTNKSQARTRSEGASHQLTLEALSTDSEMSQLVLCIVAMSKTRKLDAELAQWSALRKSPRLVMPRVDKELLQTKYQEFVDTQYAVKAAVEKRTAQFGLPNILFASVTRAQDTERLHQLEAWVSRAEGCLGDLPPQEDLTPCAKKEDVLMSTLTHLKERSDTLAGTRWQCQDPQFYNVLLEHQLQEKQDLIISTIAKGQETAYSHLLTTSLSTLQKQGEMWNQRLQLHAGELAQALLQNSDLEKDGKSRSILKAKDKSIIEELQTSIAQKKSHIQVAQKQITQLQHTLTLMNQQAYPISDLQGLYEPYIQKCIQSHIHGNTLPDIKKAFIKATEEKAKKHSSTHNFEEEVEMKEIEKTLLD